MRAGLIASAILHLTVLALIVFDVPLWSSDVPEVNVIPVEIIPEAQLAEVSTPPPQPEPEVEATPEPTPPPAPPPPAPPPAASAESVPPLEEITPQAKPRERAEPAPRPTANISPRTKPKAPPRFDAGRIAALLDKSEEPEPQEQAPVFDTEELGERLGLSSIDTQRQLARLQDVMRTQIERCWSIPAGAENAENLIIVLRILLRPDGSLLSPPELVNDERLNDPDGDFFRIAAESARRAVQRCTPLKLPAESYEIWRASELTFDPRRMLDIQ